MVESNGAQLTEHEAELYDRQIRLWGLESQKRLRASRILIAGLNGLGAEIAKNIILAGVKSVVLLDDKNVSEIDFCSQFLATGSSKGTNRAEASLDRARALNPMVEITADTTSISSKPKEFFGQFDVVVLIEANTKDLIKINGFCREQNVKFFATDVWGDWGYSFADLQEHEFVEDVVKHKVISKPGEKIKTELVTSTVKRTLNFTPIETMLSKDFVGDAIRKKIKRTGPVFPVIRYLQTFRDKYGHDPDHKERDNELKALIELRKEDDSDVVPDSVFNNVFGQISPVAAIVGGEVAQEIIKTVSKKEAPHCNTFLFNPDNCCGFVEKFD